MAEPKCTLSDDELLDKCSQWVSKLCLTGGRAWSLQVPVNFEQYPDILFSELISRYQYKNLTAVDVNREATDPIYNGNI